MIKIIEKLIGVMRANLIFVCKINSIKHEGFKHYVGRLGKIKTEKHGEIIIGKSLYLSDRTVIGAYKEGALKIGNNNFFNSNCNITCYGEILIGDNNLFGQNVVIVDHNHKHNQIDQLICKQGFEIGAVSIGSDCWICANVVICSGAVIGDHVIVAANSVVNGKLLVAGTYAGAPAKLVKRRI